MKKLISLLLTVIIILSSATVVSSENGSTCSSTASNFISFLKSANSKFLISRDNYFYMKLASETKSHVCIQYCIKMSDLLIGTGAKPDKQKYREALVNIITVHDLDSANSISEQKKLDNLKDLKDYSMDIVSIATDYISLSSFKNPETQKIKESISTAMGALNVLAENTDNWIEAFSDLETVIQNYAYYDEFLKLVEDKAEDKDLSDAAKDLRTSLTRTMEIKLETYSDVSTENFGNYTEYFFTDALFTVAKQVPEYENDETFKSFIDSSGNIVGTVKDSWNLGVSIGTLVGNFVAGGENLINRIFEMEAIHNISVILQDELLDDKYVNSINTENEIDYISRYVTFSEFLISSRIRGEYCFLSVMSEDAGLLNNFYKSTAKEAKKQYDTKVEALLATRDLLLGMVSVDEDNMNDSVRNDANKEISDNKTVSNSYDLLKEQYNNLVTEKGRMPFDAKLVYTFDGTQASYEKWYENTCVVSGYIGDFGNDGREDLLVVYEEPASGSEESIAGTSSSSVNYGMKFNTRLKASVYTCENGKIKLVRDFEICSISNYSGDYETFISQKNGKTYLCTQLKGCAIYVGGGFSGWYINELSSNHTNSTPDDIILFTTGTDLGFSMGKIEYNNYYTLGSIYDDYGNLQTSTVDEITNEFEKRGLIFNTDEGIRVDKTNVIDISKISVTSEYDSKGFCNGVSVAHTDYIRL